MTKTRWQVKTKCQCISFGCANTPVGYATLTKPRARQHRLADESRLNRQRAQQQHGQLSCEDVPESAGQVGGLGLEDAADVEQEVAVSLSVPESGDLPLFDDVDDLYRGEDDGLGAGEDVIMEDAALDAMEEYGPGTPFSDDEDNSGDPRDDFPYLPEYSPPPSYDDLGPMLDDDALEPQEQDPEPAAPAAPLPAQTEDGQQPANDQNDPEPSLHDFTGDCPPLLCPAKNEILPVRLLYLQVVLGHVCGRTTVAQSEQRLKDGLQIIKACNGSLPLYPKPARSLITAKRRLGLTVDDFITKRPICTVCFKFYSEDDISKLESPSCLVRNCKGKVWRFDDEKNARVPAKIHSYVSLLKTLQRFFLRPDFVKNFHAMPTTDGPDRPPLRDDEYMYDFCDGRAFGHTELGRERMRLEDGTVADVQIRRGPRRTLMSVDIGCSMTINVDWFGIVKGRHHSTGGMYITFNNLDRTVRYLQHNVHLAMNMPGPKEPSLEQLNHLIEPLYKEMKTLYEGTRLAVHGREEPAALFGAIEMRSCDLPGSRKLEAFAAHNHKRNPCFFCHIEQEDINTEAGYDVENFVLREEWKQIKAAFDSRDAKTAKAKKAIFEEHGQRWSQFLALAGWKMSGCAIDYMHNFYLGIAKDMFLGMLVDGHLLNKSMWQRLEDTVNAIQWPSGIGRLPSNLADHRNFAKADQWRRWVNIQPTILYIVWRDAFDRIRSDAPDVPPNAAKKPSFLRNLREIYDIFLYASVTERILASKSISMEEVKRGHEYLRRCCSDMLRLGIHLVPNHHLAMHYPDIFRLFGPVYAWWLYAHERFNGMQEKVNHNGKADGVMELTLTRWWVLRQRLLELLVSFPPGTHPEEHELIQQLLSENKRAAGTLRAHLSTTAASLMVPRRIKKATDLRRLPHQIYPLLLEFLRAIFPDLLIANELNTDSSAVTFSSRQSVKLFPIVVNNGTRYGSLVDKRSKADRVGCVEFADSRIPCRILYHCELTLKGREPVLCSVVQRMRADDAIPAFPWSLYATDLGIYVAYADSYQDLEVVYTTQLAAPVAIIPFHCRQLGQGVPLWSVHSFDRTGIEEDDEWFNKLQEELEDINDDDDGL